MSSTSYSSPCQNLKESLKIVKDLPKKERKKKSKERKINVKNK